MASAVLGLVLDSSVLVAAERAKRTTSEVIQHIRAAVGEVPVIICALTVAELAHGIHRADSPERRHQRRQFLEELKWRKDSHSLQNPRCCGTNNLREPREFPRATSANPELTAATRH